MLLCHILEENHAIGKLVLEESKACLPHSSHLKLFCELGPPFLLGLPLLCLAATFDVSGGMVFLKLIFSASLKFLSCRFSSYPL